MSKVQFKISGDGSLIENQGTSTGSSSVQLSNGRATIKLNTNKGKSVVSVSSEGLSTAFIEIE
jgi:beta-galactosidase